MGLAALKTVPKFLLLVRRLRKSGGKDSKF